MYLSSEGLGRDILGHFEENRDREWWRKVVMMDRFNDRYHISSWKEREPFFIFLKPMTAVLKPSVFLRAKPT